MKKDSSKEILICLRTIEELLNKENRSERLKSLERENEMMRGYIDKIEEKVGGLEKYFGIDYIKQSKYIKK